MRRHALPIALVLPIVSGGVGCAPAKVPVSMPLPRAAPIEARRDDAAPGVVLTIDKSDRTLMVWSAGRLVRRIDGIQLGPSPTGPKRFEGDGRTPEGRYVIDWRNPRSAYHLSLHVSYPGPGDTAYARSFGRSAGGLIMIHGQPNGSDRRIAGDWTDGCIALSNSQIEDLWDLVPDGATVEIEP